VARAHSISRRSCVASARMAVPTWSWSPILSIRLWLGVPSSGPCGSRHTAVRGLACKSGRQDRSHQRADETRDGHRRLPYPHVHKKHWHMRGVLLLMCLGTCASSRSGNRAARLAGQMLTLSHPSANTCTNGTEQICLCDPQDEAGAGVQSRFGRGGPPFTQFLS
jgi:hypothetical protein